MRRETLICILGTLILAVGGSAGCTGTNASTSPQAQPTAGTPAPPTAGGNQGQAPHKGGATRGGAAQARPTARRPAGCLLVVATGGLVLNGWKNVRRSAEGGFTSIIHGKYRHEETRATASQALLDGRGHYLVVLNEDEATFVCDYIRGRQPVSSREFLARFEHAVSDGFDPDRNLQRIGCANQTTMLSSESLKIGEMFRAAMRDRYGDAELDARFRAFDTICSATQDRQDAVMALLADHPPDLMIVIGGYNSSNTCNLAKICAGQVPTYHIAAPDGLVSVDEIRHKHVGEAREVSTTGWLPAGGLSVGLTSGASTPDNLVGAAIRRLEELSAT